MLAALKQGKKLFRSGLVGTLPGSIKTEAATITATAAEAELAAASCLSPRALYANYGH